MRNIPEGTLDILMRAQGNEPINIIEVQWQPDSWWQPYSDELIEGITIGKILQLSNLENVLKIDGSGATSSLSIVLDDTDGSLKNIFNYNDIHKRPVRVFQSFKGLPYNNKFLIFEGQINSPISWKEGDRTLSFEVVSKVEDFEVGFTPEETAMADLPKEAVGKAWPLAFGTTVNFPGLTFQTAPTATTLDPFYIFYAQKGNEGQEQYLNAGTDYNNGFILYWEGIYTALAAGIIRSNVQSASDSDTNFFGLGASFIDPFDSTGSGIGGGSGLTVSPLGDISIQGNSDWKLFVDPTPRSSGEDVISGLFKGLSGAEIGASEALAEADSLEQEGLSMQQQGAQMMEQAQTTAQQGFNRSAEQEKSIRKAESDYKKAGWIDGSTKHAIRVAGAHNYPRGRDVKVIINDHHFLVRFSATYDGVRWSDETMVIQKDLDKPKFNTLPTVNMDKNGYIAIPPVKTEITPVTVQAGATVTLDDDYSMDYIYNIIPSTLLSVKAYKSVNNIRTLVSVPRAYYEQLSYGYGQVHAQIVRLKRPLTYYKDESWEDQIYISQASSIGPNVVNIIAYIIRTYSNLSIDHTTFDPVKNKLENYPCNFILTEKRNILDLLNDIAFQSRCALWIIEGVVYIRYLSEELEAVDNITEDDIDQQTLEISSTPTEDIITKITGTWKESYEVSENNKMILRFNVAQYGVIEQSYDFFTYTDAILVQKSLTYWLIQKSNTWKTVKFSTSLNKLPLETFDIINLNFTTNYVADAPVKGIIKSTQYNSDTQTIDFEVWVPVRFGEMLPYPFFWPAYIAAYTLFPTLEDVFAGRVQTTPAAQNAAGQVPVNLGQTPSGGDSQITLWSDEIRTGLAAQRRAAGFTGQHAQEVPFTPSIPIVKVPGHAAIPIPNIVYNSSAFGDKKYGDKGDRHPSDLDDSKPSVTVPSTPTANPIPEPSRDEYHDDVDTTIKPAAPAASTSGIDKVGTNVFLGKVVSGSGKKYKVDLYGSGTGKPATKKGVTVTIPQIDATETIPKGTVLSAVHKIVNGTVVTYEAQPPVWM